MTNEKIFPARETEQGTIEYVSPKLEDERVSIDEGDRIHLEWYKEAKEQTPYTYMEFLWRLCFNYEHDYGTIVHAMVCAMLGAANAIDKCPSGGITGAQAEVAMWLFLHKFGVFHEDSPLLIIDLTDLQYPPGPRKMNTISWEIMDWLRLTINKNLNELGDNCESSLHPAVLAWWKKLSVGIVPEGLSIRDVGQPTQCNIQIGKRVVEMGYRMRQSDTKFFIPEENKVQALKAIKELVGHETIKDSGGAHFSWVDTDRFKTAETLGEALYAWRWGIDEDKEGNVVGIFFNGEKLGDDEILFQAITPFVRDGSFISMIGEDDHMWRWLFKNKTLYIQTPKTIEWE